MDDTKPYKFIGFGAMDVTKPYEFIWFGAMDVTKPYEFIWIEAVCRTDFLSRFGMLGDPMAKFGFFPLILQSAALSNADHNLIKTY